MAERLKTEEIKKDGLASIIKYEGNKETLAWKHPIEDFNLGSQLIVHESQEAIFFRDGQALDLFGAGRYTLETQQLPILEKLYSLPTDTEGTFHSEVYFINLATQMGIKWGTDSRVRLFDPMTGMHVELGASGEFSIRVTNSRKLLLKLVGTTDGLTQDQILGNNGKGLFRSLVMTQVKSYLAAAIRESAISILEIDERLLELSEALRQKINPKLSEYGLEMPEFYISRVVTPDDDPNFRRMKEQFAQQYLNVRDEQIRKNIAMAEAERKTVEAQAAAQMKIIGAQGDAEVIKIKAQAEAEAYKAQAFAEAAEMQANYQTWVEQAEQEGNIDKLLTLVCHFEKLNGYRDSDAMAEQCRKRRKDEMEKIATKWKLEAEIARKEAERIAERNKRMAIICTAVAVVALAVLLVVTQIIVPNAKYNNAVEMMEAGNLDEAYNVFRELGNYKDALDKAATVRLAKNTELLKTAMIGDYVIWGSYEQDNDTSNSTEDIEWLVLDKKDGKALVISKYALDCQRYNTEETSVTWETCSLRQWLNKDFLNTAFSTAEQAMIPTITVSADKNPSYSTDPGKTTQDKVFLLSIQEANKYFASDSGRQCAPTDYAVANGAYVNSDSGNCWWWLRSPGDDQDIAALVDIRGGIDELGDPVLISRDAVRPALWIDLGE